LHDSEYTHPVYERRKGLPTTSDSGGGDFAGIKPRDWKPADAKENLEDEDEGCGGVGGGAGADAEENGGEDEAK